MVRLRDRKLPKEDLGHVFVVVLPGVHDRDAKVDAGRRDVRFSGVERADDRRDLHEVGARAGDQGDGKRFQQIKPFANLCLLFCLLCLAFRPISKIPGESRANIVPNGDSPFDFPSVEIEHPPPPVPEDGVVALASLEYVEFPAPLTALTR
jgi:hypothetical protein